MLSLANGIPRDASGLPAAVGAGDIAGARPALKPCARGEIELARISTNTPGTSTPDKACSCAPARPCWMSGARSHGHVDGNSGRAKQCKVDCATALINYLHVPLH